MDRTAATFINEVTPKYADYLTRHYEDYAQIYPEWHKMSEVAKIIALARWAKQNHCDIKVIDASGAIVETPQQVDGFWSAVFQVNGEKASLTVMQEGGASFSQDEGEDWMKVQPNVTTAPDVLTQLAASTVLAEQAAMSAVSGDLEAARALADKSALAMTGEIDLNMLPPLSGIPLPGEPAAYAAATAETINQVSDCLHRMDTAQKDLTRAGQLAATAPDDAAKLTQQAQQAETDAQAELQQILKNVSTYKSDPSRAGAVAVALRNKTGVVTPTGGTTVAGGPIIGNTAAGTTTGPATAQPQDWSTKSAGWIAELDKVNKQIDSTRNVLLKLNASTQADRKLFEEWEKDADAGFERCVNTASDVVVDFGAGAMAERYDEISRLAKKLPGEPKDVIEKYRYLASLAQRLKEAKSTNDVDGLAKRENKTETELYETLRDGVGQVIGLLNLDKTVPGSVWKYGTLACDMAYNLTELRQLWKNVATLEGNNVRYAEAVQKLSERMRELVERQQELRRKIEAGEPVNY